MSEKPKVTRAGGGIMFLKDGKVLLGLRHDEKEKADSDLNGEGTWTFPGGKYDFQDGLFDGVAREVKEETDLNLKNAHVFTITNERVDTAHYVTLGWMADEWDGEVKAMEPDEIVRWEWFNLDNLPAKLFRPTEKMINNYKDKIFMIEDDRLDIK
ncbi:MAG: NUDIX domain-containing protein [Alphaproteobacteria bacterium]|jgi:8-oxo-dGTP diphosphatase|nr:NUDIX domain-containing protein [Alphaproteobacteria bacterium]